MIINVERAYREFRGEPTDAPWNTLAIFDGMYQLSQKSGVAVEF